MTRITDSAAWQALATHYDDTVAMTLADMFRSDAARFATLSREHGGLLLDLSRNRLSGDTLGRLLDLARAADVESWRRRLFSGETVNATEDRAALHTALRDPRGFFGAPVTNDIVATQGRLASFTAAVRDGTEGGVGGQPFRDVVALGIGGSHLGPLVAASALGDGAGPQVHFVANVDGHALDAVLRAVDPATTLFVVGSKTFTTQETMTNAATAAAWLTAAIGDEAVQSHVAALTARPDRALEFGLREARIFPFWDWVGGRFSLWSAAGLPAAIAMGWTAFDEMCAGAHDMDRHFVDAPLEDNLPVLLALAGIWNVNFENLGAHAVVPYDERLRHLPAFLQQLEMESNGKGVSRTGEVLEAAVAPVVFGMAGTNAQHTFHQWLHQGPRQAAVDFIAAARPAHDLAGHHDKLIANMLAQAEALAFGTDGEGDPHKACPGNRPSTTILVEQLDGRRLGMLIALYEHKVFVQGVIWGLNSFDQFGVELGKDLAARLLPAAQGGEMGNETGDDLDSSTAGLLAQFHTWRDGTP